MGSTHFDESNEQVPPTMNISHDIRVETIANSNNIPGGNSSRIENVYTSRSEPRGNPSVHFSYDSKTTINSNNTTIDNKRQRTTQHFPTSNPSDRSTTFGANPFSDVNSDIKHESSEANDAFESHKKRNNRERPSPHSSSDGREQRSSGGFFRFKETNTINSNNVIIDSRQFENNRKYSNQQVISVEKRSEADRQHIARLDEMLAEQRKQQDAQNAILDKLLHQNGAATERK
ncbi:uncharacterized protein CELE_F09C6.3 [Caenorhabditis elegans]|uniref:Uncharacterized protein n=1 Tax=Caenorhabditis elegans TaxID=6239 RepID=K8ESH8_CAEEL|nr:Uncharacterized protein CELE_F09C6.3 [Caenorhabditis elegans]CCO25915.1 Uncharacterized protein CELE_F09C6.3 [Caenorhabditis elegans]|eukprot:NP_507265.2 Uncharacterized protein CELE_F09C6.3 [Caenorhabditis elegans]